MREIKDFFENPIVLSAITGFFFAQFVKFAIEFSKKTKKGKKALFETLFWSTGGMPSSHSAVVCSLTTAIGIQEGLNSTFFIVMFFTAMVVLRDAVGVRRSAGIMAKTLNILGRKVAAKLKIDYTPVKEVQGHTPMQVLVGSFLGIFIAAAYAFL